MTGGEMTYRVPVNPGYSMLVNCSPHRNVFPLGYNFSKNFHPYTVNWLNALPSPPAPYVVEAIDNFITACVNDGNWDLIDRLWILGQDKRENALIDVKNPTIEGNRLIESYRGAPTNSLNLNFNWRGFTRNGNVHGSAPVNGAYLDTQTDLSTLTNYQLNSAFIGFYMKTDKRLNGTSTTFTYGVSDGTNFVGCQMNTNTNIGPYTLNSNATSTHSIGNCNGPWTFLRTASTLTNAFTPTNQNSSATVSTAIPSGLTLYLFSRNVNGTSASATEINDFVSMFIIGGAVKQVVMRTRMNALALELGWNKNPNNPAFQDRTIF